MNTSENQVCLERRGPLEPLNLAKVQNIPPSASNEASVAKQEPAVLKKKRKRPESQPADSSCDAKSKATAQSSKNQSVEFIPQTFRQASASKETSMPQCATGDENRSATTGCDSIQCPEIRCLSARLLQICVGETKLDNDSPLCALCCDTLILGVESRIQRTSDEMIAWKARFAEMILNDRIEPHSWIQLVNKLSEVEAERIRLFKLREDAKAMREAVYLKGRSVQAYRQIIEEKTEEDYRQCLLKLQNHSLHNQERIPPKIEIAEPDPRVKFPSEDVAIESFTIEFDGPVGRINGHSFGFDNTRRSFDIDWDEVNIAWSHVASLFNSLVGELEFTLSSVKLVSNNGRACFKLSMDSELDVLPLFVDLENYHGIYMVRYDAAQILFVKCMQLLEQGIRERVPHFSLPYPLGNDGSIWDKDSGIFHCLILTEYSPFEWTNALKCVLVNLKSVRDVYVREVAEKRPEVEIDVVT